MDFEHPDYEKCYRIFVHRYCLVMRQILMSGRQVGKSTSCWSGIHDCPHFLGMPPSGLCLCEHPLHPDNVNGIEAYVLEEL
jgi:hypothetical protein